MLLKLGTNRPPSLMHKIHQFAKPYATRLTAYARALPPHARAAVAEAIRQPSFVVSCADRKGRSFVTLHSPTTTPQIAVGTESFRYDPARGTRFVTLEGVPTIEEELFPPARTGKKRPQIMIGQRWLVLEGLAFSSADFAAKYWRDASFARLTGFDIPFEVAEHGSVLVVNLLFGYEDNSRRIELHYELIHAFGSESMLPMDEEGAWDFAFRDFSIACSGDIKTKTTDPGWSFAKFLGSLERPVEQNVLVLGSYKADNRGRFEQLESVLHELHWCPFKLIDAPDLPIQTNVEKFIAALICSRFVIVIDDEPSGHIAEVNILLHLRFRPVVVLRSSARPSTMFLEDKIRTDDQFRVAQVEEVTRDSLLAHIEWAIEKSQAQIATFNEINSWRRK